MFFKYKIQNTCVSNTLQHCWYLAMNQVYIRIPAAITTHHALDVSTWVAR